MVAAHTAYATKSSFGFARGAREHFALGDALQGGVLIAEISITANTGVKRWHSLIIIRADVTKCTFKLS